jgi:hypothetical protein
VTKKISTSEHVNRLLWLEQATGEPSIGEAELIEANVLAPMPEHGVRSLEALQRAALSVLHLDPGRLAVEPHATLKDNLAALSRQIAERNAFSRPRNASEATPWVRIGDAKRAKVQGPELDYVILSGHLEFLRTGRWFEAEHLLAEHKTEIALDPGLEADAVKRGLEIIRAKLAEGDLGYASSIRVAVRRGLLSRDEADALEKRAHLKAIELHGVQDGLVWGVSSEERDEALARFRGRLLDAIAAGRMIDLRPRARSSSSSEVNELERQLKTLLKAAEASDLDRTVLESKLASGFWAYWSDGNLEMAAAIGRAFRWDLGSRIGKAAPPLDPSRSGPDKRDPLRTRDYADLTSKGLLDALEAHLRPEDSTRCLNELVLVLHHGYSYWGRDEERAQEIVQLLGSRVDAASLSSKPIRMGARDVAPDLRAMAQELDDPATTEMVQRYIEREPFMSPTHSRMNFHFIAQDMERAGFDHEDVAMAETRLRQKLKELTPDPA